MVAVFYDNKNYQGTAKVYTGNWNACVNFSDNLNKKVSSIRIGYTDGCHIYDSFGCQGLNYWIPNNFANLDTVGWNDFASSFKCIPSSNDGNNGYGK
jgi:hypothetical protein